MNVSRMVTASQNGSRKWLASGDFMRNQWHITLYIKIFKINIGNNPLDKPANTPQPDRRVGVIQGSKFLNPDPTLYRPYP